MPTATATRTIGYEYTDTFGGEANYSWVNRGEVKVTDTTSELAIVRRVKAAVGLNNVPCRKDNWGDMIVLYPYGYCSVLFIHPNY
jgi:hypothetical protein